MLSSSNYQTYSTIPCWPQIELALNQLFPTFDNNHNTSPLPMPPTTTISSDDFLKLYTLVFEHCVGPVDSKKSNSSTTIMAGLNASAEELYFTLVKYIEIKFKTWSQQMVHEQKQKI